MLSNPGLFTIGSCDTDDGIEMERTYKTQALSLAALGFGNVFANMAIAYAITFKGREAEALDRILAIARGCITTRGVMTDDDPVVVEQAREIVANIVDQCEAHARGHLRMKPARDPSNLN